MSSNFVFPFDSNEEKLQQDYYLTQTTKSFTETNDPEYSDIEYDQIFDESDQYIENESLL